MDTVRAVIFDLDDTLYSYEAADEVAFAAVADYAKKRFGLEPERTRELHDQCFARQKRELGDDNAGIHSRIVRFEKFLEELKKPVFPHALNLTDLYWNTFLDHMTPEPGITELLRVLRLRGIQTVVGTNMTAYMQFRKIAKLGIGQYIDTVLTSEEAGAEKPSLKFFMFLLTKLGRAPGECVYIGDNARRDYEGAENAGIPAVWYAAKPGVHPEEEEKTVHRITDYSSCLKEDGIDLGGIFISYR